MKTCQLVVGCVVSLGASHVLAQGSSPTDWRQVFADHMGGVDQAELATQPVLDWAAGLDQARLDAIASGSIEPSDESGPDVPTFDDTWWPGSLTLIGYPRPSELDEHIREPWDWSREMLRHVASAQPETLVAGDDGWVALLDLANGVEALLREATLAPFEPAVREWVEADPGTTTSSRALSLGDYVSYGNLLGAWAPDELAPLDDPEVTAWVGRVRSRVDTEIGYRSSRIVDAEAFRVTVPPSVAVGSNFGAGISLRRLSRYLEGRLVSELRGGDWMPATETLLLGMTVGQGRSHLPTIVGGMGAVATQQDQLESILREASGEEVPPEIIKAWLDITLRTALTGPAYAWEGDRITTQATFDEGLYASSRGEYPESIYYREQARTFSNATGYFCSRGTQSAIIDLLWDSFKTYAEARPGTPEVEKAARVVAWQKQNSGTIIALRAPLFDLLLPNPDYIRDRWIEYQTVRNGSIMMLAIERSRAETGSLPESLGSALTPDLVLFNDDYASGDGTFRYEVVEADAKGFGQGYRLYSVGADGTDDGGTHPLVRARRALTDKKQGKGFDYVIVPASPAE